MSAMNEVTQILSAIERGDARAADQLFPLVYKALRTLAATKLAREAPGQTLQATALVHEAYLRLVETRAQQWNSRGHFFAAAAEAMRRILVDRARKKQSVKHGGGRVREPLDEAQVMAPELGQDLVALDEALERLAAQDAEAAQLVKLRFLPDSRRPKQPRLWESRRGWQSAPGPLPAPFFSPNCKRAKPDEPLEENWFSRRKIWCGLRHY
jgi:RNA polymerase sigma factor (TIGR02999 family)